MKALEPLLRMDGWSVVMAEMQKGHDLALRSVIADVSNHAGMAKQAGRLDAFREMLGFADKVTSQGKESGKELNKRGGTSSESDDGDEE